MEGDVRNKLTFLDTINIYMFQISEVISPLILPGHLPYKLVLACTSSKVLRTLISPVNYLYSLARRGGSLAITGPPALEAIHWQGKQGAV